MAEAYICSLSKVQRHAEICKEINNLYERKNHDYGDSFHQTFVEEGMAMFSGMSHSWRPAWV